MTNEDEYRFCFKHPFLDELSLQTDNRNSDLFLHYSRSSQQTPEGEKHGHANLIYCSILSNNPTCAQETSI